MIIRPLNCCGRGERRERREGVCDLRIVRFEAIQKKIECGLDVAVGGTDEGFDGRQHLVFEVEVRGPCCVVNQF